MSDGVASMRRTGMQRWLIAVGLTPIAAAAVVVLSLGMAFAATGVALVAIVKWFAREGEG